MPRTRALTPELRAEDAAQAYARRVKARIRAEAMLRGMTMTQLLARAGLEYGTVMGRLDAGRLRLSDLAKINAVLKLEPSALAELVTLQGRRELIS